MNICGLASLVSAMILSVTEARDLPKEMEWLWKIDRYNNFCRAVFIDWFVKKKINTNDLFSFQKVYDSCNILFVLILSALILA